MRRIDVATLATVVALSGAALAVAGGENCQQAAPAKIAKSDSDCGKSPEECLSAMAAKIQVKGWLGIETEKTQNHRYRVVSVQHYSPAQDAGFETGDLLVALNGVRLDGKNKQALKKIKSSLGVGSRITYTVERDGHEKMLDATLAAVPDDVMARWIGEHMLDQHAHIEVASR